MRLGGLSTPRQRQETDAERLHETRRGKRGRERQQRAADRKQEVNKRLRGTSEPVQKGLESEPLARKAVQGRQAGNRHRGDEEEQPGPRHASQQPAEALDLPRAGGRHDVSGPEEQQPLEHRVIQHVVEARRDADRCDVTAPVRQGHHSGAKTEQDDPDVLDAGIRKEPLEIVLHERIQDAEQRREPSQRQNDHAPREPGHAQTERTDADDSVDAGLDQHAGHQRRNTGRRRRVGIRQPHVERDDARLHAEPEDEKREQPVTDGPDGDARQQRRKRQRCRRDRQRHEPGDQTAGADVRHDQVQVGGATAGGLFMFGRHERRHGQRHQFPAKQEGDHIARHEHDLDGAQQRVERDAQED